VFTDNEEPSIEMVENLLENSAKSKTQENEVYLKNSGKKFLTNNDKTFKFGSNPRQNLPRPGEFQS